jgi:hypothetical protein
VKKSLAVLTAVCGLAAFSSVAEAKPAKCDITNKYNNARYQGPCDFRAGKGNFEVDLPRATGSKFGTQFYYVEITSQGQGELYSDWVGNGRQFEENLIRDRQKPACWAGENWRICVY